MQRLELEEKRSAPFAKLSGGQKQPLFIALALLPDPRLVFLDELTTGLDPQARHSIWNLVRDMRARGRTVVLITHFVEEAEHLCDRVAILDHGRIVALVTEVVGLLSDRGVRFVDHRLDGADAGHHHPGDLPGERHLAPAAHHAGQPAVLRGQPAARLWAGEPWDAHLLDAGVPAGMLVLGVVISIRAFRWE